MEKNRKTATKLCLIQWSRFQNVQIKLEGSTLFTGINGSGKSTILDAMTYLLTGNRQFNKAAKDRDRTVLGYVRGDTRSNGKNRYLRTGEVVSYVAMEFYSPVDDNTFVAGVCMESPNETDCRSYWFVLPDTRVKEIGFADIQGRTLYVYPRNQLTVKGKSVKMSLFMSQEKGIAQILRALGLRCDAQKYRGKLLKMMAFNPENNIDKFIQDCVLEPGKIDSLKELREQKQKFEQLKGMFHNLELSKKKLEELEKKTEEYEAKNRNYQIRELMLSYQQLCDRKEEKENIIFRMRALEERLDSAEKRKAGIESRLEQAEERRRIAENNDLIGGVENSIRALEEQLRRLKEEINENETGLAALLRMKGQLEELETRLSEKVELEPSDADTIRRLQDENVDENLKRESFLRISGKILDFRQQLGADKVHLQDEVMQLQRDMEDREKDIKNLESNRMVLPPEVESAKQVIVSEFQRKGIKTDVRVFAELVKELKDEAWRAAIETFLGRKRFYIIVEGAYCEEAMRILQDKKLYQANVVITDRLPETEVESGSVAELLSIPNIYARRYANYLLNGIHRCESLEELHEHPKGGLMKNGMLAKSYAVSVMNLKKTRFYLGADAIRLQLIQLRKEQEEEGKNLEARRSRLCETEEEIKEIDAVEWKAERYDFAAPNKLHQSMKQQDILRSQKESLENDPEFMAVMEEVKRAREQCKEIQAERDEAVGDIGRCEERLKDEREKQKTIAGEIYEAEQDYEEMRIRFLELESAMLEEYQRLRSKSDSCLVIKEKTVKNLAAERENTIKEMENLQMAYARLAEIDLNRRGVSFIPFYRGQLKEISNVRLEEVSEKLAEQAKTLESAFMNDFVAEINEMVSAARTEIELINRELKQLPFGSDTYRFVMEEKADRKDFFRICRKLEELGSAEFYLAGSRMDEELEHDIQNFMNVILEEEDEEEYTDYRRYFTYDMRISTNQGDEEIEADLSRKQGSASNGEKQTPYFIILAASLMQCYPKTTCCVRLAFIDEAFSALSRERIEQMVRYFEENHFQVIYAAPPEKIGSIGSFIQSTVSLVITGRYTNMIEGLVKADGISG
ncbi:MAG: AAA family ATPase [Firmicutes bacterium]|nr:AAA family ATPase [Bacillota bacterium]